MRLTRERMKLGAAFLIVGIIASSFGAAYVRATISSVPTAIDSQYSCEKGVTIVVAVDNGGTPNYYAMAGSGLATVPCGTLIYGGPNNAGGKTGTNAAAVINAAIVAGGTGSYILLECGTYTLTAPIVDGGSSNVVFSGSGWPCTKLIFTAAVSTTSMSIAGQAWTFTNFLIDCSLTWSVYTP
jgi:hypothetical protein